MSRTAASCEYATHCDGCGEEFKRGKKIDRRFKTLCGGCLKMLREQIAKDSRPLQIERELPMSWYLGLFWRNKKLFRSWVEMHPGNHCQ